MSTSQEIQPSKKSRRDKKASFRPNFTFSIFYLFFFFFLYSMLFMIPSLLEFAGTLPPSMPAEEASAKMEAHAQALIGPRLIWMLGASLATTALGIYSGFLPGVRPKR
jgi:hypothetical protein